MTVPPPEPPGGAEPSRDRSAREPSDHEVDDAFARLVAGWGADEPAWPGSESPGSESPPVVDAEVVAVREEPPVVEPAPSLDVTPLDDDVGNEGHDDEGHGDEGHYEPPEPPPVPTLQRATVGALVLIAIGAVLLLVPGIIGLGSAVGFPLGLLSVTGGLAWLMARLRPGPPPDSGWDDGAQI